MSKLEYGHLDCASCTVADERAALNDWVEDHAPRFSDLRINEWLMWQTYLHGKAAAIPPLFRLVPINPEWDAIAEDVLRQSADRGKLMAELKTFLNKDEPCKP